MNYEQRNVNTSPITRAGWWLFTGVTVSWLLWLTLRPDRTPNHINLVPLAQHGPALSCLLDSSCHFQRLSFRFLLIDVVGNTLVFMPLGLGLAGALQRGNARQTVYRAALGGFLVSTAIELLQLAIPSRATDVDDLIFNTLGALVGALLFYTLYYQIKRLSENVKSFK
jgi:glycopeptide antibiotics resistance protein